MPTKNNEVDVFEDMDEVKNTFWKAGKPGDYLKGILTAVREVNSQLPGHERERVKVYEVEVIKGEYHNIDEKKNPVEPAVTLEEGTVIMLGGRKTIDDQMRQIKLCQIFGIKFMEEKASKKKGFAPMKVMKIFQGPMSEKVTVDELEASFKEAI